MIGGHPASQWGYILLLAMLSTKTVRTTEARPIVNINPMTKLFVAFTPRTNP